MLRWIWWCIPVILTRRRQRQEDCEFTASPAYVVIHCLKKNTWKYQGTFEQCVSDELLLLKLLPKLSIDVKIEYHNGIIKNMNFEWSEHVSKSFVFLGLLFNGASICCFEEKPYLYQSWRLLGDNYSSCLL
jgi:hypothetical protein